MHIVVLPLPVQSHVNPCLAVARLLVPHGFTFTIVLTQDLVVKLNPEATSKAYLEEENSTTPSIQYTAIPCDRPPPGTTLDLPSFFDMVDSMRPGFETLLHNLISSPPGVSCIITTIFLPWSVGVASELNILAFAFYPSNAQFLTLTLHTQMLISQGLIPVEDPDHIVDCVPGLPPIRAGDLPEPICRYPYNMLDQAKVIEKAAGVIINTVYELEKDSLEALKRKIPIYSIGLMLFMLTGSNKYKGRETVGRWTEERECLNWLDTRPASSVLFIAFGSVSRMSDDQVKELAEGLEASGHAFLWVIRADAVEMPLSTLLPEGFTERTKDRGLIISWAPQLEVLSHPAVGGFFTHCGWNSITENLALGGLPMICWPQLAEQRLNKLLLVDKWKVGLELQQEEDGIVKRAEVEKVVTQLMQEEVGRELKKRVLELKEIISLAIEEGGSSQSNLKALGRDMKKLGHTSW